MNKTDLINKISNDTQYDDDIVGTIINCTIEAIKEVTKSEKIVIKNFGVFERKERKGRIGTNPKTKEKIDIPKSNNLTFKSSKSLKEKL